MRVSLLGPVGVQADDGTPIGIGGVRLRMLIAKLALDAGWAVTPDSLVAGLWGAEPPGDAANALQSLVSRLRKALIDGSKLAFTAGGYALEINRRDVDVHRFEELAERGRRELTARQFADASTTLSEALALWRGEPLADVRDAPFAEAPAARLTSLRISATEDWFEAELALGRHGEILTDIEAASREHPLRERLAALQMRALHAVGRQADALGVYELVRRTLAEELGVDPSTELRDAHLGVLRDELPRPVARVEAPVDQLSARLTSFVGREQELARLTDSLTRVRLVTVVGPGGAGKTRLAIEAANRHHLYRRGRMWFVALAGAHDATDVSSALLSELGARDARLPDNPSPLGHAADALDRIAEVLRGDEALLVLDNCEHVVGPTAELAHELVTRLPNLRIIATSREPLAITGEALCPLEPLDTPEAMRLFTERAVTVRPGFALDDPTRDAVTEICRRLDGMPLALELAAARLRSMTVHQIVERLDDRFRLLTSGSRVALPRQRTLRAVVEWSWNLLDDAERALARRLAVFPRRITVSAAEMICADEILPREDVLYVLSSFVDRSILTDATGEDGVPAYRMLETIRAYGEERLVDAGERDRVTSRFVTHFLNVAEEHEPLLRGRDQPRAIAVFDAEHDNMATALRWLIDREDLEAAYRLIGAMLWYWVMRGFTDQLSAFLADVARLSKMLQSQRRHGLNVMRALTQTAPTGEIGADPVELFDSCVQADGVGEYPAFAVALPMLCLVRGEAELAWRGVRRWLDHPDPWVRAWTHLIKCLLLANEGDVATGEHSRDLALAGFRQVGDRWGSTIALAMKAESQALRGAHAEAIASLEEGLAFTGAVTPENHRVKLLSRLTEERMRIGDSTGAWLHLRELQRIAAESGEGRAEITVMASQLAAELTQQQQKGEKAC